MKASKISVAVLFLVGLLIPFVMLSGCEMNSQSPNDEEWSQIQEELLMLIQNDLVENDGLKLSIAPLSEFDVEAADKMGVLSNNISYAFFSGIEAAMYGVYIYSMGPDPECSIDIDDIGLNRQTRRFLSCALDVLEEYGSASVHIEDDEIHVHSDC